MATCTAGLIATPANTFDGCPTNASAAGAPGTNVTVVLALAGPNVPVTVFVSAIVDESVAVNTPLALVVPLAGVNTFAEPLDDSVTDWPMTGFPLASFTVTVSAVVDVPSAVTVGGLATIDDCPLDGAAATKRTVALALAPPNVAVTVFVSAVVDASVAVNVPLASVIPPAGANTFIVPLDVSVTGSPATGLPLTSSTVTVSMLDDTPSAVTAVGFATIDDFVLDGAPATKRTVVLALAAPKVAVTVLVSTVVDASVAVT
jgi:hypothetical protein